MWCEDDNREKKGTAMVEENGKNNNAIKDIS